MIHRRNHAEQVKFREEQVARITGGQSVPELPDGLRRRVEGVARIEPPAEPAVQRADVESDEH